MPPPDRYVTFCTEQLQALGPISTRYMFGGWCLYCDGMAFALVADGALFLKVDQLTLPEFSARGLQPFRPFADQNVTLSYFQAPPELFEDEAALRHWGGLALAAAARKQKPKPKKAARKKT